MSDRVVEAEIQASLRQTVDTITKNRWAGRLHTEMSPVLEEAWKQDRVEDGYLAPLAKGIANLGTKSGVELLLAEIDRSEWHGDSIEDIYFSLDARGGSAFGAMDNITNPEAIPPLLEGLSARPLHDPCVYCKRHSSFLY